MHWLGGRHALPVPLASPHPPPGKHLDSHTGIEPVIASVVRYAATELAAALCNTRLIDWPLMHHSGLSPLPSPTSAPLLLCAGVPFLCAPVCCEGRSPKAATLTAPEGGRLAPVVRLDCYFPVLSNRLASGCQRLCSTTHFVCRRARICQAKHITHRRTMYFSTRPPQELRDNQGNVRHVRRRYGEQASQ